MQIFLFSDIHFQKRWYPWIANQKVDLTLIAGNLMGANASETPVEQMLFLERWCQDFPGALVVSSGKADINQIDMSYYGKEVESLEVEEASVARRLLKQKTWMEGLKREHLVTDGQTVLVETTGGSLIVSTIPACDEEANTPLATALMEKASMMRRETRMPWIVLHNEPPAQTAVAGKDGSFSLVDKIRKYRPNFVISGQLNKQAYKGFFADKIEGTWCFNPGYPPDCKADKVKTPNRILLDLQEFSATWYATPRAAEKRIVKKISLR